MEYLLVVFDETRDVYVNGQLQGQTNTIFQFAAGTYDVTLGDPKDFSPSSWRVRLQNTAPLAPCRIEFKRVVTAAPPAPPRDPA